MNFKFIKLHKKITCRHLLFLLLGINLFALSFIFTPLTNYLYALLEVKPNIKRTDGIILLASGHYTDDILARDTYQRIFHAFRLYKKGYSNKIIVCGRDAKGGSTPVSEVMKEILVEMGVVSTDIITETYSENTYESIKYVLPLLKKFDIKKPLLVTSSFHMYRSLSICKKIGLEVYPAPVPCYEKEITSFLHRNRHVLIVLREYGAIVYFWLRRWV